MTRDPLEFMEGEGAREGQNIPERFRLEKRQNLWRNAEGRGQIESGMFSGGSDTIPGHVPVQETQLRS